MSVFGKILASITVPSGGWTFQWDADDVTVAAGSYATPLHLGEALRVAVSTAGYGATASFTSAGIYSLTISDMSSDDWANTTNALSLALGFDETEAVVGTTLTGTNPHPDGWYPGTISFGATGGVGLTGDSDFQPVNVGEGVVSGAGQQAHVGPSRPPWERTLSFGYIERAEMQHRTRGPIALKSRWRYRDLVWYPDRDDGDCGDYGTQGDPDDDATADYWLLTVVGEPQLTPHTQRPDLFNVQVRVNGEPD